MKYCKCGNVLTSNGYCHECQMYDTSRENSDVYERVCEICNESFYNLPSYMCHLDSHPICESCEKRFISSKELKEHRESHHKCSLCNKYYSSLSSHIIWNHPYCEFCNEWFLDKFHLERHMEIHPKCTFCDKVFHDQLKLDAHLQELHKCEICKGCFNNVREHVREKHPFCNLCKIYFIDEASYEKHNEQEHTFSCTYCGEVFNFREKLNAHLTSVHICSSCNTYFDDLPQHFVDMHFYCKRCKEPFFSKDAFISHNISDALQDFIKSKSKRLHPKLKK